MAVVKAEDSKANKDTSSTQSSKDANPQASEASAKPNGEDLKPNGAQPLAPPPKPSQGGNSNTAQTPDYFSGQNKAHFSLEPNPFEQSFGNPSTGETPGKFSGLPSVANLTSPAPLGAGSTPNWQDSLRAGPLSPAMLQGPTNQANGYFDDSFRNNYPTPNESSLRTGLTPGGGGSMFPAPSPNTQAIFNLQSGGATPGTLEFQRTAMNAAARSKADTSGNGQVSQTSHDYKPAQQNATANRQDPFGAPESEAVNSLYMLAQTGGRQNNNQFAVPNQSMVQQRNVQNQGPDTSPTTQRGTDRAGSNATQATANGGGFDESDEQKPSTRSRGKKNSTSKSSQASNGRRKADETPAKAPAKKRQRGNAGEPNTPEDMMSDDDGASIQDDIEGASGRKMTDDEKRRNFLERNRIAALKCRQRKKQWLANLQSKVEFFTQTNDALEAQCTQLREEIINLKTLLLAHKDCPVSHQQGLGGQAMAQFMGDINQPNNPYGQQMMGMQNQAMQRS